MQCQVKGTRYLVFKAAVVNRKLAMNASSFVMIPDVIYYY